MIRPVLPIAVALVAAAIPAYALDRPNAYAVRLALRTTPGASVQRIVLPGRVLAALRRTDLGDLRVFDAGGRVMPTALIDAGAIRTTGSRIALRAYPILGGPGAFRITGVSMRFDEDRSARIVGVEGTPDRAPAGTMLLGVLLDTRGMAAPAEALLLDADLPAGQPVTFTIEASADLADWNTVARKTVYRAPDAPTPQDAFALAGADLAGRYLRVRWTTDTRPLGPVRVRGATLTTVAGANGRGRVPIAAVAPPISDPHRILFTVPLALRPVALRIAPPPGAAAIPVRLFGRRDGEQPWTPLGNTTVYRLKADGRERSNGAVDLPDDDIREIRIDADPRSAGFGAAPAIDLYVTPRHIAVLLSGTPPFVLAAGAADAQPAYLPIAGLVPDGRFDRLPVATVPVGAPAAPLPLSVPSGGASRRTLLLWTALLLGTLALGGMVWTLYRGLRRQAAEPPTTT